ncbi:amidohydrolase family protein [Tropicibacter sp. S64]|uniref:amidohydrolase family protein n=1 Tax=Tropicibacter sp. S64 TaxID=3415122 RepID=UPI003C7CA093
MKIDAHQHFWQPARGDYGWMPQDDPILSRPYGPADLSPALAAAGIDRTVLVQAAPTVHETEYMLGIADVTEQVAGVVGWVDFEDPSQQAVLERLARHPKFFGVRPMIQDLPDDDWMLQDSVQWAFEALVALDLTFDCLGFPRHIDRFHALLTRHPAMRAVLDHCLKPQIRDGAFNDWADGMARLARETGAYVKLSGIVTETDGRMADDDLAPYVDHVLTQFGAERVMWGSDWPVVRLACEYGDWHAQALRLCAGLGAADKARVFGGTAAEFYRI